MTDTIAYETERTETPLQTLEQKVFALERQQQILIEFTTTLSDAFAGFLDRLDAEAIERPES